VEPVHLAGHLDKVKTFIYQAGAERDQYFNARLFGFAQLIYNHNYSQNLELQQSYMGGLGFALRKRPQDELDLKASLGYIDRAYYISSFNKTLIGSTFGEEYHYRRKHVSFHEELSATPAWNNSKAWALTGNAGVSIPVSDNLSVEVSSMDSFLHAAPSGYKRNSFQLSMGISYDLP